MTPMVFILMLIGAGCVSDLLMRFIVWLDGADAPEDAAQTAEGAEGGTPAEDRREAA